MKIIFKPSKKSREYIRRGDTYQTNLTQQIRAELPENLTAATYFSVCENPSRAVCRIFKTRQMILSSAFRPKDFSKSKIQNDYPRQFPDQRNADRAGKTIDEDLFLKNELLNCEKDRAENAMIVDLLRNDIGRICEFGTVKVEKLCDLETHPTLFHLVSTIRGKLRENIKFSDIFRAVFPCGSITGAPKIRTMRIIDELETAERGLSMGAIGYSIQNSNLDSQIQKYLVDLQRAIRTMVVKNNEAILMSAAES